MEYTRTHTHTTNVGQIHTNEKRMPDRERETSQVKRANFKQIHNCTRVDSLTNFIFIFVILFFIFFFVVFNIVVYMNNIIL